MKKPSLLLCVFASLMVFVNASVWEGAAAVASGNELPAKGLYMATDSFPPNTVVDVTNLENGKKVRLVTSSGLNTPGLLGLLSQDASEAIGLQSRTLGRISISQASDPASASRISDGNVVSGDPDFDPAAFVALNSYTAFPAETASPGNERYEGGNLIVDLETEHIEVTGNYVPQIISPPPVLQVEVPEQTVVPPPSSGIESAELVLSPAENRPPVPDIFPDTSLIIPGIADIPEHHESIAVIDSSMIIDSIVENPVENPVIAGEALIPEEYIIPELTVLQEEVFSPEEYFFVQEIMPPIETVLPLESISQLEIAETYEPVIPEYSQSVFSAPLITRLETGSYYLQIAAFNKEDTVRNELNKIDGSLPVVIMNAGTDEKPVYRVLIGPVNLGESGALLQCFKINYKDAFIRQGS